MLFPELSRNEINSMKASEAFFLGLPRRIKYRDKKKVFLIGFHKTGTSSMGKAFQILGYRVCGSLKEGFDYELQNMSPSVYIFSKAETLLPHYDCFQDTPWFMFYRELYKKYPDAYFILTIRPEDEWIKSVIDHFGNRNNSPYHKWIYGYMDPHDHEEAYLERYRLHNQNVISFFTNNSNFIKISLKEDNKWNKICQHLGVPQPNLRFPCVNTSGSRTTIYRRLKEKVKDIYYRL